VEIDSPGRDLDEYLRAGHLLHQHGDWKQLFDGQLQAQQSQPARPASALAHLYPLYGTDWHNNDHSAIHSLYYQRLAK